MSESSDTKPPRPLTVGVSHEALKALYDFFTTWWDDTDILDDWRVHPYALICSADYKKLSDRAERIEDLYRSHVEEVLDGR